MVKRALSAKAPWAGCRSYLGHGLNCNCVTIWVRIRIILTTVSLPVRCTCEQCMIAAARLVYSGSTTQVTSLRKHVATRRSLPHEAVFCMVGVASLTGDGVDVSASVAPSLASLSLIAVRGDGGSAPLRPLSSATMQLFPAPGMTLTSGLDMAMKRMAICMVDDNDAARVQTEIVIDLDPIATALKPFLPRPRRVAPRISCGQAGSTSAHIKTESCCRAAVSADAAPQPEAQGAGSRDHDPALGPGAPASTQLCATRRRGMR